ncbi:hypothetical protein C0995_006552 [Termitomyces sp. Mi166|nr:hypothetical protein C0995_006552 [Termitomyces sp. Mi166\
MGIGQTVKNMIGSSDQTASPTTGPDSHYPFIEGQSGKREPGRISNFRSQYDRNDNTQSAFGGQAGYDRSSKLSSDASNGMYDHGETTIPGNKVHEAVNKEYIPGSSELGGIRKGGTIEADYGDRGYIGTGVTGATTGTQHQRHTSDVGGTGFGGATSVNTTKLPRLLKALPVDHTTGHSDEHTTKSTEDATKDSRQLHHVNQHEIEEVLREKEYDQHVVHHAQPVTDKNVEDEVHPVISVHKTHANKPEETKIDILQGQTHQHKDSREEGNRERTVIDKGESVNEREIHHVHHVVQPIINKESSSFHLLPSPDFDCRHPAAIDQHRIHTIIPIHQITHEAPIVHKSQTHAPVTMEHFVQKGGQITGGLMYDQIGSVILRSGECSREVDGEGEKIARKLTGSGLPGSGGHFGRHSGEGVSGPSKERPEERDRGPIGTRNEQTGANTSKRGENTYGNWDEFKQNLRNQAKLCWVRQYLTA